MQTLILQAKVRQLEVEGYIDPNSAPMMRPRPTTPPVPGNFEPRVTVRRTESLSTRLEMESAAENEEEI